MPKNIYERNGILWARFKVNGVEYRESLRTRSEKVAEKRLKARREQIQNEAHYGIAGPQTWVHAFMSWTETMEAEVRSKAISPKTVLRYTVSLNECRQWLDSFEVHQIDAERLRELVKARKAQHVTNATIRRDLTAISSVLDHAIEEGWVDENAARAYPRKRLQERRDPIVLPTDDDISFTIGREGARFADLMLFARATGMREEEIASLEHSMIDILGRRATIVGKRNRLRTITLSADAIEIIGRQPRQLKCPYVFWNLGGKAAQSQAKLDPETRLEPRRYTNVASNFASYTDRAAKRAAKAGITYRRFSFHHLRHLFAVEYLREGRGGIYDLQRELGHTSVKTTEIYLDYLTPDQAKAAREGVAQKGAQGLRSGTQR